MTASSNATRTRSGADRPSTQGPDGADAARRTVALRDADATRRASVRRYAASFAGPWTGDDPIVHDAGVVIEVDEPGDDAVHLEGGRFRCAVTAELRSQGAVVALLEATIEGAMRDGRPVAGTGTVRHAR